MFRIFSNIEIESAISFCCTHTWHNFTWFSFFCDFTSTRTADIFFSFFFRMTLKCISMRFVKKKLFSVFCEVRSDCFRKRQRLHKTFSAVVCIFKARRETFGTAISSFHLQNPEHKSINSYFCSLCGLRSRLKAALKNSFLCRCAMY